MIKTDAVTRFYNSIPTVWDETRFLDGEMGRCVAVARRSGTDWYVGLLNVGEKKKLTLPLNFLKDVNGCKAVLYYQASGKKNDVVNVKTIKLRLDMTLDVETNSGCVLHIVR